MQINQLNNILNNINKIKSTEVQSGELGFQDLLSEALGVASTQQSIPQKWSVSTNRFGFDAVDNAVKFLQDNQNIDANQRIPTYQISSEDKQWLSERNNLSDINNLKLNSAEENNLLADLVFKNAISPEDAKSLHLISLPIDALLMANVNASFPDIRTNNSDKNYMEKIQTSIDKNEEIKNYCLQPDNQEIVNLRSPDYYNSIDDFIASKKNTYNVISDLMNN